MACMKFAAEHEEMRVPKHHESASRSTTLHRTRNLYATSLLNCPKSGKNARIVMVEGTVLEPDQRSMVARVFLLLSSLTLLVIFALLLLCHNLIRACDVECCIIVCVDFFTTFSISTDKLCLRLPLARFIMSTA